MQKQSTKHNRYGFTLVEMLVSVGLLLLIMSIFAQIFSLAATSMTTQRGIAQNDQRARTAFTLIDGDLKRMSYRTIDGDGGIKPLVPGMRYNDNLAADEQAGYIYYAENDPNSATDDTLQFTVDASVVEQFGTFPGTSRYAGQNSTPYFGYGTRLASENQRDQPAWDDGDNLTGASLSERAEVCYFLRNGTLYRRVLLIRDAVNPTSLDTTENLRAQPGAISGGSLVDLMTPGTANSQQYPGDSSVLTGNFYSDFDFSAHFDSGLGHAQFHGSLSNEANDNSPLGTTHYRFGFSPSSGYPREYFSDGGSPPSFYHFGRYTHDETSNVNFEYPQDTTGNIFGRNDFNVNNFLNTGRLSSFQGGSRRGADIVLPNVHSFDVQIWDGSIDIDGDGVANGSFVNIDTTQVRDFGSRDGTNPHNHQHDNYGSSSGSSIVWYNTFDTWHPTFDGQGAPGSNINPPMSPIIFHPTSDSGYPTNNNTAHGGAAANVPDYVAENRIVTTWDNSSANPTDLNSGGNVYVFPTNLNSLDYGSHIVWQASIVGGKTISATSLGTEPNIGSNPEDWPNTTDVFIGTTVNDANDYDGNPGDEPDIIWTAIDNRRPTKAIRITIVFRDPTSDQMRQASFVHSFNE